MSDRVLTDITITVPQEWRLVLSWLCARRALECFNETAETPEPTSDDGARQAEYAGDYRFRSWKWLCQTHDVLDGRPILAYREDWSEDDWREVWDGLLALARRTRSGGAISSAPG